MCKLFRTCGPPLNALKPSRVLANLLHSALMTSPQSLYNNTSQNAMLRAALMQKPLRKLAGLRCGYASRHLADSAAAPDHFTANLQHKTEEELRQLLADQGYDPDEQELPHILKSFEEDSKAEVSLHRTLILQI